MSVVCPLVSSLSSHFQSRLSLLEQLLAVSAAPPLDPAVPTLNKLRLELGQLRKELSLAAEEESAWRHEVRKAEVAANLLKETQEQAVEIRRALESCPTLPCNQAKKVKVEASKGNNAAAASAGRVGIDNGKKKADPVPKKKTCLPQSALVLYPTQQDFTVLPKYMKGRLTYEGLNCSIDEFNKALAAKYNFLLKGFNAMASVREKTRYKSLKALETKDTKDCYFLVMDDLKGCVSLRTEAAKKSFFSILRHLQKMREVRGPGPVLRYVVKEENRF